MKAVLPDIFTLISFLPFGKRTGSRTHVRRAIRDALDGLPLERYRRICGLFDAVVPAATKAKNGAGVYTDPMVQAFETLRSEIKVKLEQTNKKVRFSYQADDLGHDAHNLHLLLGELLPETILDNVLPALRDDYRVRVPCEVYTGYLDSPGSKALARCDKKIADGRRLELLRADYVYLINEIRRLVLLEYHIEEARGVLIRKLRGTLFKLLTLPVLIVLLFLTARALVDYNTPFGKSYLSDQTTLYKVSTAVTLLSLAAIVGAIGSFISALLRIEAVPESSEIGRSLVALRSSDSIRLAPLTGFVFAIVLSLIFAGELVSGLIFPAISKAGSWPLILFFPGELAKWLTWSFIVGFSERLMPDMIDRLVARADKSFQGSAPANARSVGGNNAAGRNGAGGDGTGGGHKGQGHGRGARRDGKSRHKGKPAAAPAGE